MRRQAHLLRNCEYVQGRSAIYGPGSPVYGLRFTVTGRQNLSFAPPAMFTRAAAAVLGVERDDLDRLKSVAPPCGRQTEVCRSTKLNSASAAESGTGLEYRLLMNERLADARSEKARSAFRFVDLHPTQSDLRAEVLEGLRATPKSLPAKLFYDDQGSALFEQITELPEYYLTRTEIGILRREASEIVSYFGDDFALIEFGSGNSTKIRLLLDVATEAREYMAVDISSAMLRRSARELHRDYPHLLVTAVCADYTAAPRLPEPVARGRRIVFFPGSTIGNFTFEEAAAFLRSTAGILRPGDLMVLGTDLRKDQTILHAAYNDAQGITAAFNLNVLRRINRHLGSDFDVEAFEHVAFFNDAESRIEMHLRSLRPQRVQIGGETILFGANETIHTENSCKYDLTLFRRFLSGTGFAPVAVWTDPRQWFAVHLLEVEGKQR
jgi:dimethylhistidine N-methyltransferase